MAQPPCDRQSIARPVHTRFEPGHLAQACLVDAYARVVPLWRRARLPLLCSGSLDAVESSGQVSSLGRQPQEQKEGQRCS